MSSVAEPQYDPRKRRSPKRLDLPEPFDDRVLIRYFEQIGYWHGYIKFLGLPHRHDEPDVALQGLFVEPFAGPRHVRTSEEPKSWQSGALRVIDLLEKHDRLVLLGDPGSGKSTLLNWIAWSFTRWDGGEWVHRLGPLVPIPLVVRELTIDRQTTWDGLVQGFLNHGVNRNRGEQILSRRQFDELVGRGQALFLVDGLDEIGNPEVRRHLADILAMEMEYSPKCRWLITSRIVGYEEAPLVTGVRRDLTEVFRPDGGVTPAARALLADESEEALVGKIGRPGFAATVKVIGSLRSSVPQFFIYPFDDTQVGRFAYLWFHLREKAEERADEQSRKFLADLRSNPIPRELGRNPNLLTLIALIYKVQAQIPHGRAVLFDKISEAYLESIDAARGMKSRFKRKRMERWLAYVAFQMQLRRGSDKPSPKLAGEILVGRDTVYQWLVNEGPGNGTPATDEEAKDFLDYIGRRSGLLIPRGEGRYAFAHLSRNTEPLRARNAKSTD